MKKQITRATCIISLVGLLSTVSARAITTENVADYGVSVTVNAMIVGLKSTYYSQGTPQQTWVLDDLFKTTSASQNPPSSGYHRSSESLIPLTPYTS